MEISQLKAFVAVADRASFSAAADALSLTQPAVSKRVAQLEQRLGLPLLLRRGRQLTLTDHGATLLPKARQILAEVDQARQLLAARLETPSGRLLVGTAHHIGLHRLPPVLAAFAQRYEQVDLQLRFQSSEAAAGAVATGQLDLGIVTLPDVLPAGTRSTLLWEDPLQICVGTAQYRAAQKDPAAYLAQQPAILPSADSFTRRLIDQACARIGLLPQVRMATDYLETIKMMVSVGLGWSVLPHTLLGDSVRALPVEGFAASRQLGAVLPALGPLSSAADRFIQLAGGEPQVL